LFRFFFFLFCFVFDFCLFLLISCALVGFFVMFLFLWGFTTTSAMGSNPAHGIGFCLTTIIVFSDMISQEGQSLKDTISISCYVIISGNCKMAATAINKTWGRRCNHIRFLVNMGSKTCGLPVLYLKNTKVKEKYQEAISKIYNVYGNESDWTLVATDDTYIIMENMRFLINRTSPDSKIMYGYITNFSLSRRYPRMYNKYSSTMLLTRAAMTQYTHKSRVVACPSSSTLLNLYDLLCMKKFGISYEVNGSKSLNVVPPELRISLPTNLIKVSLESL
jgi:hypothetical protein